MDPNPILDEGNPTSTAGMPAIIELCDIIGREVHLDPPHAEYSRGWGPNAADTARVIASWTLMMQDMNDQTTSIRFDVTDDESPITIGMDVKLYSITDNIASPSQIVIKRPHDSAPRILETYASGRTRLDTRLRLLVAPIPPVSRSMLGKTPLPQSMRALTLAKRIHNATHASEDQTLRICDDAGWLTNELRTAIHDTCINCHVCTRTGPPAQMKKISLNHVNQNFNDEIQADFLFVKIRKVTYTVIHFTDTGTAYSEGTIVEDRKQTTIIREFERTWLYRHGAPNYLSADDEFHRPTIVSSLAQRGVSVKPRPARRHNKVGIIERKNGTVKRIIEKLQMDDTILDDAGTIISKSMFLSNVFSGSSLLSAFQLTRGYSPSILGSPSKLINQQMLNAHKHQAAIRALHRLLRSRNPKVIDKTAIKPGDEVLFFYNSSKQNEDKEWRAGTILRVFDHYVEIKSKTKGPPTRAAFEDIRIKPAQQTAQELMDYPLDDIEHEGERDSIQPRNVNHGSITEYGNSDREEFINELRKVGPTEQESRTARAMFARQADDIGTYDQSNIDLEGQTLQSNEKAILHDIYANIGPRQVSSSALAFAPSWVVEKAMNDEHDKNWKDAYEEANERDLAEDANIVSSHSIFKVKKDDLGNMKLKGRIVIHGNHDADRDKVRADCAAADMAVIRMLISIGTCLGLTFGSADITGAYMQSGPITREVYVRPPRECKRKRGVVWRLKKLPYGLADAGRQWSTKIEGWMQVESKLERVFGVPQLFMKKSGTRIDILVAKVTDDFLVAGKKDRVESYMNELKKGFDVGKVQIGENFKFNGCEIRTTPEYTELSMIEYTERIQAITISRSRKHESDSQATAVEEKAYRALAGTLMFLGNGVLPQAALVTSKMQQRLGNLKVSDILDANRMTNEILRLTPTIRYAKPNSVCEVKLISLSDASHGANHEIYGQTGFLCGMMAEDFGNNEHVFHPLIWGSHKQRRVSYSSFGSEIIAAADADDHGYDLKLSYDSIFSRSKMRHEILVDSRGLFDTITTVHEPREYRLKKTVAKMRDAFEAGELDGVSWIDGKNNLADCLTKWNIELSRRMNKMLTSGIWDSGITASYHSGVKN